MITNKKIIYALISLLKQESYFVTLKRKVRCSKMFIFHITIQEYLFLMTNEYTIIVISLRFFP